MPAHAFPRLACSALALAAASAPLALAGDPAAPDRREVEVIVRRSGAACPEGEDCRAKILRRVVVDPGDELEWVAAGPFRQRFALAARGGFLGVQLLDLTPELRRHFGAGEDRGVLVARVLPDTAAERAGLAVGDVITEVAGEPVGSPHDAARAVAAHEAGATIDLAILRGGAAQTLTTTLGKHDSPHPRGHRRLLDLPCDEGDDCADLLQLLDCGGAEPCVIKMECEDGDCTCVVNGEPRECPEGRGRWAEER